MAGINTNRTTTAITQLQHTATSSDRTQPPATQPHLMHTRSAESCCCYRFMRTMERVASVLTWPPGLHAPERAASSSRSFCSACRRLSALIASGSCRYSAQHTAQTAAVCHGRHRPLRWCGTSCVAPVPQVAAPAAALLSSLPFSNSYAASGAAVQTQPPPHAEKPQAPSCHSLT
jgi:hypothetical protein